MIDPFEDKINNDVIWGIWGIKSISHIKEFENNDRGANKWNWMKKRNGELSEDEERVDTNMLKIKRAEGVF